MSFGVWTSPLITTSNRLVGVLTTSRVPDKDSKGVWSLVIWCVSIHILSVERVWHGWVFVIYSLSTPPHHLTYRRKNVIRIEGIDYTSYEGLSWQGLGEDVSHVESCRIWCTLMSPFYKWPSSLVMTPSRRVNSQLCGCRGIFAELKCGISFDHGVSWDWPPEMQGWVLCDRSVISLGGRPPEIQMTLDLWSPGMWQLLTINVDSVQV